MTPKEAREKANIARSDAAKQLNITTNYLSMIETGKRKPGPALKLKMAVLYNIKLSDLEV